MHPPDQNQETSRPTVLVVDDEALVRMFAVDMLIEAGFAVREADCAAQALEQLALYPQITVLFSDINMPGAFDGLELARRVHALRPDVHLILTSGRVRPSKSEMCDGDFVAKPYNVSTVPDLIRATRRATAAAKSWSAPGETNGH